MFLIWKSIFQWIFVLMQNDNFNYINLFIMYWNCMNFFAILSLLMYLKTIRRAYCRDVLSMWNNFSKTKTNWSELIHLFCRKWTVLDELNLISNTHHDQQSHLIEMKQSQLDEKRSIKSNPIYVQTKAKQQQQKSEECACLMHIAFSWLVLCIVLFFVYRLALSTQPKWKSQPCQRFSVCIYR